MPNPQKSETKFNPYSQPIFEGRTFKTSLFSILLSTYLVLIMVSIALLEFLGNEPFQNVVVYSLPVYISCKLVKLTLSFRNLTRLRRFIRENPEIKNRESLQTLKPILRENMRIGLGLIPFLIIESCAAMIFLLNDPGFTIGIFLAVLVVAIVMTRMVSKTEEHIKQLRSPNPYVEMELNQVLHCWVEKPFPTF